MFEQEEDDAAVTVESGGAAREAAGVQKQLPLAAVLICAAISAFMMNSGFFSLFFLAPLGYAVLVCGSVLPVFFVSVTVNAVFSVFSRLVTGNFTAGIFIELVYFSVMFFCFAWIISGSKQFKIRTAYRFILSSSALAICFSLFFIFNKSGPQRIMLDSMAEILSSVLLSYDSAMREFAAPENVRAMLTAVILRGGAVSSFLFLFFINRHLSIMVYRLVKKQAKGAGLTSFFTPPASIWVFSCSLAVIVLTRMFRMEIFEIIAWNAFVICAILFLAQGAGIVMNFLSSRAGVFRFFASIFIVLLVLSPLSIFAIAALILLGIAEIWLPLRAAKREPVSTPKL